MIRFYHYLSGSHRSSEAITRAQSVRMNFRTRLAHYHAQAAPSLHTIQAQVGRLGS